MLIIQKCQLFNANYLQISMKLGNIAFNPVGASCVMHMLRNIHYMSEVTS